MKPTKMTCPSCKKEINIDNLLVSQFEESIRKDLQTELRKNEAELEKKRKEYVLLSEQLTLEKQSLDELVRDRVKSVLQSKEESLKESIRKEIDAEKELQLKTLEKALLKKSEELTEMNGTKAELVKLKAQFSEVEAKVILAKERELLERLEQAKLSIKEQEQQASFLKIKERETVINQLKEQLEIAKRKAEQGSMQIQGEVQELALEDLLKRVHPSDDILEVKKGQIGADCIQVVKTTSGSTIGKILYESKSTKNFSDAFIKKLKQDNLVAKCDIMVIVTQAMPKDVTGKFAIRDGVWICQYNSVQDLSLALRFGLLKLQSISISHKGKESKMQQLYNYLTSQEFKELFEAILTGFKNIQDLHNSEKLKIQKLWKEKEKQLESVLSNTINFYGSLRGISGADIQPIQMLELPKAI